MNYSILLGGLIGLLFFGLAGFFIIGADYPMYGALGPTEQDLANEEIWARVELIIFMVMGFFLGGVLGKYVNWTKLW